MRDRIDPCGARRTQGSRRGRDARGSRPDRGGSGAGSSSSTSRRSYRRSRRGASAGNDRLEPWQRMLGLEATVSYDLRLMARDWIGPATPVDVEVRFGDAVTELAAVADVRGARLVVARSSGRWPLGRLGTRGLRRAHDRAAALVRRRAVPLGRASPSSPRRGDGGVVTTGVAPKRPSGSPPSSASRWSLTTPEARSAGVGGVQPNRPGSPSPVRDRHHRRAPARRARPRRDRAPERPRSVAISRSAPASRRARSTSYLLLGPARGPCLTTRT